MPTFPSLPDVISQEPWHLTDATGLDLYFDVPGAIQWTRPEEARLAQTPCGGPPTLLTTNTSRQPRQFRVTVRINRGPNRDTRLAALEAAWAAHGPYTLTAGAIQSAPLTVILDASQGPLQWQAEADGARTATVGFQECSTDVAGAPTAGTALLTWEQVAANGDGSYTIHITWDYSGTDQTAQDAIYVYQPGTTDADIRGAPFDPNWWPIVATGGLATGSATVITVRLTGEPSWRVAYFHYQRGLLPQVLTITVEAPASPAVQIFWSWLTSGGATPTYAAAVTWVYALTDMTPADQIYLFQAGTTGADIAANATDPVSGRWFPVVPTYGTRTASAAVEIDTTQFNTHEDWRVGYYHPVHGLLDGGLLADVAHGFPEPPVPSVALTFAWEPPVLAPGNFCNYLLTWDYGWADQHPDDYILIHDSTTTAGDAAAATNDYPDYHYYLVWTVGRAGRSGSVVLQTPESAYDLHTPRALSYYSVTHNALLGTITLPDFPL